MNKIQVCTNCVMDTTDSKIMFDENGVCDHCRTYYKDIEPDWNYGKGREEELEQLVESIKKEGKGKDFDCLMGMSGGIDSSYLLYKMTHDYGLRPLVFHVDAGWNSQLAVNNIEKLIDGLGLDLYTEVINWEEMRDLQLAFFKSGVPHIDVPQDHAFFATMYKFASKHKIKYILTGVNQDQLYVAPNTVMVPVIEKSKITKDVILFVGSFTKRKGLDRLVRLFNNIKDRIDSDINLMLIGDGQEKENIEHLIEELKLENRIKLVGRINNSESLIPYFKRAILSISLSQAGLSVLQSMGFGVPFFTLEGSISGGETSNIDHNINGFIVKDNDLLIEEELIKILNDRKRTEACGNSAKEHYLRYASIKNYAQGFIDAIEKESKTNVYVVEK